MGASQKKKIIYMSANNFSQLIWNSATNCLTMDRELYYNTNMQKNVNYRQMQVLHIWGPKILHSDKGAWRNKLSIAKKDLASEDLSFQVFLIH